MQSDWRKKRHMYSHEAKDQLHLWEKSTLTAKHFINRSKDQLSTTWKVLHSKLLTNTSLKTSLKRHFQALVFIILKTLIVLQNKDHRKLIFQNNLTVKIKKLRIILVLDSMMSNRILQSLWRLEKEDLKDNLISFLQLDSTIRKKLTR